MCDLHAAVVLVAARGSGPVLWLMASCPTKLLPPSCFPIPVDNLAATVAVAFAGCVTAAHQAAPGDDATRGAGVCRVCPVKAWIPAIQQLAEGLHQGPGGKCQEPGWGGVPHGTVHPCSVAQAAAAAAAAGGGGSKMQPWTTGWRMDCRMTWRRHEL